MSSVFLIFLRKFDEQILEHYLGHLLPNYEFDEFRADLMIIILIHIAFFNQRNF